ncbi:MAG: hypothetical protein AAGF45_08875 [Pseudomonadota bacterium]
METAIIILMLATCAAIYISVRWSNVGLPIIRLGLLRALMAVLVLAGFSIR